MTKILVSGVLMAACGVALAKLPPPDDAAKAKAAETSAKAAWQAKVDGYLLCKSQDKVAARYKTTAAKPAVQAGTPAASTPAPTAAPTGAPTAAPAGATAAASAAVRPTAQAAPSAAAASGTPVAATPPAPCVDPGPFAYNPPEQKPLEAAGAHSPSGTAASPPSVKPNSAEMAPAKK